MDSRSGRSVLPRAGSRLKSSIPQTNAGAEPIVLQVRGSAIALAAIALTAGCSSAHPHGPPYQNCADAAKDGRDNIPRGDPAYAPWLDADKDGIACERH